MQRDYFKDIYTDFFKIETKEENYMPENVGSQDKMTSLFKRIDDLYIENESKNLLKKIIEYMRKYQEKIEKNYIPFRIIINSNNNYVKDEVINILFESATFFNYILNNSKNNLSLYNIEKEYNFDKFGLININSLNGINQIDNKISNKFIYELEEYLKKEEKNIILITGNDDEISSFFLGKETLKNNYFNFIIKSINPDVQDIYNIILDSITIDDKLKIELLDYISKTYNDEEDYIHYKNDLINYISFNKDLPKINNVKTIDEAFASLNELVGLDKVKKVLYELVDLIELKKKSKDILKIKNLNLHMVFLGNPGTGKTTIARLLADILYNLKYIKENKLVEVSAKDLVAEYVGQTAPKTMSVIEKSMNGVLFIDEAYTLAVKNDNSYNAEAIATLIQAMENYRDKLVVIFAGYTKEMQDFLNSNSGITSRIGYTLEFDDYTTNELIQIFLGMTKKAGFIVSDDAISYLREIIDENRNTDNFGNARFIRNIYEKTVIRHATNVKNKKQKKIIKTITKNDINIDNLLL